MRANIRGGISIIFTRYQEAANQGDGIWTRSPNMSIYYWIRCVWDVPLHNDAGSVHRYVLVCVKYNIYELHRYIKNYNAVIDISLNPVKLIQLNGVVNPIHLIYY